MRLPYLPVSLALSLACSSSITNQPEPSPRAAPLLAVSEGDSLLIAVHKVRPQAQAEYERFMLEKWYPAAKRLAGKHVAFGEALRQRWRLVSLEPDSDNLLSYFFVYPVYDDAPGGIWGIYRGGGVPDEEIVRDSTRWSQWVDRAEGYVVVRKEY